MLILGHLSKGASDFHPMLQQSAKISIYNKILTFWQEHISTNLCSLAK